MGKQKLSQRDPSSELFGTWVGISRVCIPGLYSKSIFQACISDFMFQVYISGLIFGFMFLVLYSWFIFQILYSKFISKV